MPEPVTEQDLIWLSTQTPRRIVAWFKSKGYRFSWDWREVWQAEHARAFTVAKAMKAEVLAELRRGVELALEQGWSERRFLTVMSDLMQRRGWWGKKEIINPAGNLELVQLGSPWRLKTIYRTNLYTSFARGRFRTLQANIVNRPYWMYDAKNDSLTRDTHRALDNKVWPATHPIWNRISSPNGWNCRCMIRALTADQVREKGLKVEETATLPEGFPDEGWDFNPAEQTVGQLAEKVEIRPYRPLGIPPPPAEGVPA